MAGDEHKEGDKGAAGEDVQQLKTQLNTLQGELESVKTAKADLEKKADETDRELLSPEYLEFLEAKKSGPKKPEKAEGEVNFEEMTPTQIAKHLETKYKGDMEKASKDIGTRIDAIEAAIGKTVAQIDLAITGIKHKDFGDAISTPLKDRTDEQKQLVDVVHKVATENPSWTAERCLRAARQEIKAAVDEKASKEAEKVEKERKALSEKGGASSSTLQGKDLNKEEASDLAWKASFGNKTSVD